MNPYGKVSVQRKRILGEFQRKGWVKEALSLKETWLVEELAKAWAREARMERSIGTLHESLADLHAEATGRKRITLRPKAEKKD